MFKQVIKEFAAAMALLGFVIGWPTEIKAQANYNLNCPANRVLVGIAGGQGSWMNYVRGSCARIRGNGTIDRRDIQMTGTAGKYKREGKKVVSCPNDKVMVGFTGAAKKYVHTIRTITCRGWDRNRRVSRGRVSSVTAFSKKNGSYIQALCPENRIANGIRGKHGIWVDRFTVNCNLARGANPPPIAKSTTTNRPTTGTVKKGSGGQMCVPASVPCPSGTICRRC
jgi:hypothetical protein